ncbi:hypothetical protein BCR44DRAFT_54967 [Catenaria anguillulae PL171]|uniref:Galactose oxidase n=1 Tax=Catenaria anguillulae PL171 TaxID=765915 RepID=A0A1Y2HG17_9FUNG|nr:hypothetical protein BCR44DRAFT_54967 [Catenaria anguillulae PL171]
MHNQCYPARVRAHLGAKASRAAATLLLVLAIILATSAQRSPGPAGAAAVLDSASNTLYLFGGYEVTRGRAQWTNRAVASLDLSKNFTASTTGLSLDYPVTGNTGIAYAVPVVDPVARLVHIIGGFSGPQGSAPLRVQVNANSTLVFSLDSKTWTTTSGQLATPESLNVPRDHARMGNTLTVAPATQRAAQLPTWMYGGHDESRGWLRDLVLADPSTDPQRGSPRVTLVNRTASAGGPSFRAIPCITPVNPDRIIISGGTNSAPASLADVWEFTPSTSTWKSLKAMAMGRINHRALMFDKDEFLLVIGGQSEALRGSSYILIEYLHFPTMTWYRGAIDNADASPIKSLTGHVAHVVGNQVVLVGGTFVKADGVSGDMDTTPPPVSVLSVAREAPGSAMLKFRWTDVYDASPLVGATLAGNKGGKDGQVEETSGGKSKLLLIAGAGAAAVVLLAGIGVFVYVRRRRSNAGSHHQPPSKLESGPAASFQPPLPTNGPNMVASPTSTMQSTSTSLPGYATNDQLMGKPPTFPSTAKYLSGADEHLYLPPNKPQAQQVHIHDDTEGPLYLPSPSSAKPTTTTTMPERESLYLPGSMPSGSGSSPTAYPSGAGMDAGVTVTLGPLAQGASAPVRDHAAVRREQVHHLPQH